MDEPLSAQLPSAAQDVIAATWAAKTTSLQLESLPESVNTALQARLAAAHRLDGAAIADGEMAVLGFRLPPESRFVLDLADEEMKFFPFAWCLEFGAAMTVSAIPYPPRGAPGLIPRVFLGSDSPAVPLMARGKFRCVFYNGKSPARYCEVFFGARLKVEVDNVRNHQPDLYQCDAALFWEIWEALKDSAGTREYLRPEDRLSIGWQHNYRRSMKYFLKARDVIMAHCEHSGYKDADLPASVVEFFGVSTLRI
jgi:hypothetical protein